MSGARGIEGKLIDQQGGFTEALADARRLANLPADAPIDLWPPRESFIERLGHAVGGAPESSAREQLWALLPPQARAPVIESLLINGDIAAAVLPYALTIR
jgi:protease-4